MFCIMNTKDEVFQTGVSLDFFCSETNPNAIVMRAVKMRFVNPCMLTVVYIFFSLCEKLQSFIYYRCSELFKINGSLSLRLSALYRE